ncbi:MAG: amidase family protein, partial [Stackebrandtia sp.]
GKTNLHELAYGLTGENGAYGATANPYNPERIAGGSSSGTAAAVAAGLAPAGLGTDTGGSVRVPASLCGLAALRPTMGRYPQRGIMTLSHTRDTVGATARTVGDVGLLDAVLAGDAEPACPSAVELSGLRLGVVREPFWRGMESDLDAVLHGRLDALADRGVVIVDVALPVRAGDLIRDAGFPIAFYETVHDLPAYLRDSGSGLDFAEVVSSCGSADVKQILTGLLGEAAVDEAVYREALAVHRPALGADFRSLFADHGLDALAWPTTPLTAAPLGVEEVMLGGEPTSAFMAYTRTTNPGSILGWPGTTLPAGLDDAGLPVGMAFDGLPGSDRALLSLTRACEAVFGPIPPPPEARRVDSLPGGDQRAGDGDQIPRRRSGRRLP